MRGPRLKTPLLLLLLLLTSLSGTVLCDEDDGGDTDTGTDDEVPAETDEPAEDVALDIPATTPFIIETDAEPVEESPGDHGSGDETPNDSSTVTPEYSNITDWTPAPEEEEVLSPIIILIPVVLVVVIIGMIVCGIFINRRWKKNGRNQELSKEDPYLDGSSTEKVPMPMFEEDVPSVLELEMEELDQWMKKDSGAVEDSKQT